VKLKQKLFILCLAIVCSYLPTFGVFLLAEGDSIAAWNALEDEVNKNEITPSLPKEGVNNCLLLNGLNVGAPLEAFQTPDPLEPMNRTLFVFNQNVAILLVRKIGKVYELLVPDFFRKGISNMAEHLSFPIRFFNNLLQGKIWSALKEAGRFMVNAAFGIGGLFDMSTAMSFEAPPKEGFGQTLGHWGVGSGVYLVVPFVGPSNTRDFVGYLGDMVLDPLFWLRTVVPGLRTFMQFNELHVDDKGKRYLRVSEIVPDAYFEQKTLQDLLSTALACQ